MSETVPYPHCAITQKSTNPWTELSNRSPCICTDLYIPHTTLRIYSV
jgi:hypothetical protein